MRPAPVRAARVLASGERGKDLNDGAVRERNAAGVVMASLRPVYQERRPRHDSRELRTDMQAASRIQRFSKGRRGHLIFRNARGFFCRCPVPQDHCRHGRLPLGPDPLRVAVRELLMLPDRHRRLDVVHDLVARLESFSTLGASNSDDHRDFPDLQVADPVYR